MMQRETCPATIIPTVAFQDGGYGVGRDFSDCKDRPGLYRRKPECTPVHQGSPYATPAAIPEPDASQQYNFPGPSCSKRR